MDAIVTHFSPLVDDTKKPSQPPPSVRLLTPKVAPGTTPKSRTKGTTPRFSCLGPCLRNEPLFQGCAFVEFNTPSQLQDALKLHHSVLDGRQINVELTAGGGGGGEKRREKVTERNKKLMEERVCSSLTTLHTVCCANKHHD